MSYPDLEMLADPKAFSVFSQQASKASDLLKALSHETRLMILCLLAEGEKSVSELEDLLTMPQAAVSQQLARLRLEGLVAARRDGRMIYYRLDDEQVKPIIAALYYMFCKPMKGK
ncbi:MAG: winged helix-turn-helix transcriptional regulator [Rhodobiaceae bacterium]|nr:winged helix-turn-helix transcriptional regulator [Rhodobiaceae bacterium]